MELANEASKDGEISPSTYEAEGEEGTTRRAPWKRFDRWGWYSGPGEEEVRAMIGGGKADRAKVRPSTGGEEGRVAGSGRLGGQEKGVLSDWAELVGSGWRDKGRKLWRDQLR